MSGLHTHKISLSERQKNKIRLAYKKRRSTVVGLSYTDISGSNGEDILLTDVQHRAITKALQKKSGLRLLLSYDQLVQNKEGGLLKGLLEFVENNVPGGKQIISPLVRNEIAPLLKNHFIPWLKNLIDEELDTIMVKDKKGSGLKRCINKKLTELLGSKSQKPRLRAIKKT